MDPRQEITRRSLKKIKKFHLVRERVGEKNLELGCSSAGLSRMLMRGSWVGLDFDFSVVKEYSSYLGKPAVVAGENLPFLPSSFDTVLMLDFLEHVDDDRLLLNEVARVLENGGHLLISVPRSGKLLILKIKNILGLKKEVYGHRREGYGEDELRNLLRDAGFEVEYMEGHSGFFLELLEAIQNLFYFKLKGRKKRRSGSISPVEEGELQSLRKLLFLQKIAYPFFLMADFLDRILHTSHHVLFAVAVKREGEGENPPSQI